MKLKASRHRLENRDVALRKTERNPAGGTLKQSHDVVSGYIQLFIPGFNSLNWGCNALVDQ